MQRRTIHRALTWLLLTILVLAPASALGADLDRRLEADQAENPAAASALSVVINEVMPKPDSGEAAWVELLVGQAMERIYLPLVSASGTAQSGAASLQSSIQSAAQATISLAGWQVSNEDGQVYTIPDQLTALPNETYVLILFDGQGPGGDDYDASDGQVVLHTSAGLGDVFPDEAGQVALYRPGALSSQTIVDFVAWGGFDAVRGANAVAAGVWPNGHAVSFENGFGDISEADILETNESIGRYPGASGRGTVAWANYPQASLTPGAANPVQPVTFITPEDGAKVDTATLSLSWRAAAGATAYRFQLDDDSDFSSPLIDATTGHTYFKPDPALQPGVYHWRINPIRRGKASGWSSSFQIQAVDLSVSAASASAEKVLGISRVRQNKDSYLLGLDGAPEGDPTTNTPEDAWDSPAPCTEPPCADTTKYAHGSNYCVRASIRMMASYYNGGAKLSMDRISYYVLEEWSGNSHPGANDGIPDNDLGYARGMYYPDEEDQGISWALNTTINTPGGKPAFSDIKTWIDANRPIMFRRPGHMMVMDGYKVVDGEEYIHVLDPDQPPDFERWQEYDSQNIDGYWVGPASGTGRKDEASVSTDSDGDGIMDFDETVRFGLDPYDADTDDDWVPDKRDMREYVFDSVGNFSTRNSDMDGDGLRKEVDPDNDNDGSPDGCEDTDYDGIFDAGETDNFDSASSQACVPLFDILYPLKVEPENAGDPSAPDKILVQVSTAAPAGGTASFTASDFSVAIGGDSANVIAAYPSADTYFLVVEPPTKGSAAYFDLEVTLSGVGTDSESNAVYYLAKAPKDQVIVLDRSGSMSSDAKMEAAQNAASAFVDFLNDGDAIGVTSFASSASTDYPLTVITTDTVRADAITAIGGLSPAGVTALGQGVQQGYSDLTSNGDPDHDWSLVLLSDGWENVAPYWADVEAGITDAVVHTVALGEGADKSLLQSIAGAKHGQYFYVDVNPPSTTAAASSVAPAALSAGPPLAIPNTLPNRLAETYIAVGELTHGLQRLAERTGSAQEPQTIEFQVAVDKGLPQAIFTLNWNDPLGYLELLLEDPSGMAVAPDAERRDDTHHQLVVESPSSGLWTVRIRILKPTAEYHFMLSGKTMTTLLAAVGGDPAQHTPYQYVTIYGVLTDRGPIGESQADVFALVAGPGLAPQQASAAGTNETAFLQLYDDGAHGDGKAGDGLYANTLFVREPGGFTVKLVASGTNNQGETFLRYASTGFNVRPRAVYLWNEDVDTALDYESLLEANGWVVDLMTLEEAPTADFRPYALILVGPETGYHYDFDDKAAAATLAQWGTPILGLGEGGAALFSELNLFIDYGQTWFSSNNNVYAVDPGTIFWHEPLDIPVDPRDPLVQLYPKPLTELGVYIPDPVTGVTPIAREEKNQTHYPVVVETQGSRSFALWGYNAGPTSMTEDGRKLLVNVSHYLGR